MNVPKLPRGALRSLRVPRTQPTGHFTRSTGRRGYASAQDTAKQGAQQLGSDMPWAIGSVIATVAGTYLVASGHKFQNPISYPMPGSNYHGEEHDDEEHDEEEGEKEGEDQEQDGDDEEPAKADDKKDEGGNDEGEDQDGQDEQEGGADEKDKKSSGGKLSGKKVPGQPDDNVSKLHGGEWDQPAELEKGPQGQTRLAIPDAKGGLKRRSESAKGIVQGRADPSHEGGSIGDVKDGSTSPVAGNVSKQQKGISNTDTKHSYDLMSGDTHSKKPEGVPDSAKLTGTVDARNR